MAAKLYQAWLLTVLGIGHAAAATTHFGFKQIVVNGSTNVQATAINNKLMIAGSYVDSGGTHGYISSGATVTLLPQPLSYCTESCAAFPSAINASGDVVGQTGSNDTSGFLWHDGAYVPAGFVDMGTGGFPLIGINAQGEEFYDQYTGDGFYMLYAGHPGAFAQIAPGSLPFLSGINNRGELVGHFNPDPPAVFLFKDGVYSALVPPGALDSDGGVINNHGQVAGLYQDSSGVFHGFVYKGGHYARFDIPSSPASVVVSAINNQGRVAGIYTDAAKSVQRLFLYNGAEVTEFGNFPVGDVLSLAMNDAGTMIVAAYDPIAGTSASYRVLCGGTGC